MQVSAEILAQKPAEVGFCEIKACAQQREQLMEARAAFRQETIFYRKLLSGLDKGLKVPR